MEKLYQHFINSTGVTTDSRKIEVGALFFALHGASFDGNDYAVQALEQGAAAAVIDREDVVENNPEYAERLLLVDDTLRALQALAQEHRRRLAIPIIAIAGSNGKTTTKELVSRVLAERFEVTTTRGNLNNHIGVPLTLLSMTAETEFGVVEMGASAQGEIALLCAIAEPNYGILTNIGLSHLEGFGGVEGIRKGKGELFDHLNENGGRAFVPQEDEVLCEMAHSREDLAVEYYSRSIGEGFRSNLTGDYNRYNIAAAVEVGRYFGVADERIAEAILSFTPDNNRSQAMQTERNRLVVDCYNANPSSMEAALDNIATMEAEHKVLLLGDMLELGAWSEEAHQTILRKADGVAERIILVGGEFAKAYVAIGEELSADYSLYPTTAEAVAALENSPISDSLILLKGSRGIALEKLIKIL
ncbi:MAG: UDP-N-acetylmuramoyl-tripeptide--D-alanyl-D-alanine ligase [Rikenellaceae bacterium]|nr:UDP-N-acetylmuramoyl-tripeptide--D-alanyl-D-alanine ligase [Rikenellaceae bacterium]